MGARALLSVVLAGAAFAAGCGSSGSPPGAGLTPNVPSPIPTAAMKATPGAQIIPPGVLPIEEVVSRPPPDPDMRWIKTEGAALPTHLSPCRTPLAGDRDRVAGRQVVATPTERAVAAGRPRFWKSVRLVIYRNTNAAMRALAETRTALASCARHDEGDGTQTRWRSEPLPIGDEAMFIAGQMYRGDTALRGHYRGVVARYARAVVTYLDFGPLTTPASLEETTEQQEDARVVIARLAGANWL